MQPACRAVGACCMQTRCLAVWTKLPEESILSAPCRSHRSVVGQLWCWTICQGAGPDTSSPAVCASPTAGST